MPTEGDDLFGDSSVLGGGLRYGNPWFRFRYYCSSTHAPAKPPVFAHHSRHWDLRMIGEGFQPLNEASGWECWDHIRY
jgi:hypothetical protein